MGVTDLGFENILEGLQPLVERSPSVLRDADLGAQIYVNEELFNLKPSDSPEMPDIPNDPESLRERLKKINPEDFGKYSL